MKNLFAKDELKFLGAFYLERFISHLIYFAPAFWIIFFNETLSLIQISVLFSALAISTFIFEIPTGAFADLFGRKVSTLFAYILMGFLLPLFIFVNNFYLLLLLFSLWGLFGTFYSGAREAWTVDNLKYYKRDDLIKSYFLKEHSLIMLGMFLSGFLGAFIVAKLSINSIWIFAGLSWIISFFLLLPVKEHKLTKEKKTSFKKLHKQSKEAVNYSIKHKVLSFVLLATFFIMFRDSFGGELIWQPFLRDLGFPIYAFGFLFSASMILGSIAPLVAKPILKICKSEKNYLITLMVLGMLLNFGVMFVNNFYVGIMFMLSILFLIDLFIPISGAFTQEFIPSKTRATIISFKSMIVSLAYAISYPVAGFVAERFGTQNTIVMGGLFLIPAIYFYSKINLKEKIPKAKK
jgi:MFS family permease|tara:strand:- start:216 stop:1433 length:1218 start_codon:yes stop_codon:yes gene_type:complete